MTKTLIITGYNKDIVPFISKITQKRTEELLVFNSLGEGISQPYGCLVRDIILAINFEYVVEILVIGEDKKPHFSEKELIDRLHQSGISIEVLKTLDYMNVAKEGTIGWLKGPQIAEDKIRRNIDIIKKHPLIPSTILVKGYVVNTETREIKEVS